jgi:glyoxylase-like metal-dependent hydrolase (beta-lactamase superfamily II)
VRESWICVHCGVEFPPAVTPMAACPICADERVARPPVQQWTKMSEMGRTHRTVTRELEPGLLTGVAIEPTFGIGQRAILIEQPDGCILFDCIPLLDDHIAAYIAARGGLKAIVPSHPHFYGAMLSWSERFNDAKIYIHAADREWIPQLTPAIELWSGESRCVTDGLTLVHCGGHFEGGTVLHVAAGAGGRGSLLTGDVVMVTENGRGVSFMRSYPGYIPLEATQIRHIAGVLEPFQFEKIYGFLWTRVIERDGSRLVARTADRYLNVLAAS